MLPLRVLAWLADGVAWVLRRSGGSRARVAQRNLGLCFPDATPLQRELTLARNARIVAHVYLALGRLFTRSPADLNRRFGVIGHACVQQELAAGRNIILLTPHTAAMEMAGHWLAQNYDIATVVRIHDSSALLDWFVSRLRTRRALVFSHVTNLLPLIKAVRAGRHLFYLPDDDHGPENTVFVPLLGVQKATPASLGRLARACAAAVIPTATSYDPTTRRYRIEFLPALPDYPTGDVHRDAAIMNGAIERLINLDPSQYMWSAKIFRTRPPGEGKLYR